MIEKRETIRCSKCNIILTRVSSNDNILLMNPKHEYFYRACECNTKDKAIIRVPIEPIKYEVVMSVESNPWGK